jgi:hypothetical protein
MVHIIFQVDPTIGQGNDDKKIMKKTHIYVSDDKKHNILFMQDCILMHWDKLLAQGIKLTHHWVWSDACVVSLKVVGQCILLQYIQVLLMGVR